MRAIEITTPGGPDVLALTDREVPVPPAGYVRIKVKAAGVNRPDIVQRQGLYPPPPGASDLPGLEVSGAIDAVGPGVAIELGTEVMALLSGGGYAEYALAPASHLLPLPKGMSFVDAAGLPETAYTIWANVFEAGGLKAGDTLFVHGATSGIGTTAVAMAKAAGATVYGTAGTDAKCRRAEELGFTRCFNYRTEDWPSLMKDIGGAEIVLDMVGGDYVAKNMIFLKAGGRHLSIAVQGGITAEIPVFTLMRKHLTLTGSVLRGRSDAEKSRLTDQMRHHVLPWMNGGLVRPIIAKTFPLEDAAAAHAFMESGESIGKIILTL